jgi:hypothetical protein
LEFAVQNLLFAGAIEVRYAQDYPGFPVTAKGAELVEVLLTKSASWSYESEFRLIGDENGKPENAGAVVTRARKMPIPEMSLTAVILGCMATESTKKT